MRPAVRLTRHIAAGSADACPEPGPELQEWPGRRWIQPGRRQSAAAWRARSASRENCPAAERMPHAREDQDSVWGRRMRAMRPAAAGPDPGLRKAKIAAA